MLVKIKNELLIINILAVLLIVVIAFFKLDILRIILGLPFLLFFPGYALIAALFPKKADLDGVERIALSFGLSIATVPLIGFALNYTPWGIRLYPILVSTTLFIVVMSIIALFRRSRLPPAERFTVSFNLSFSGWLGSSQLDKALSVVLVLAILTATGALGYVIAKPKAGERFTEFYILGLAGKAENYPRKLLVGEEAKVIVGIVNREHQETSYRVEITVDGVRNKEIGPVVLAHKQTWEQEVSFTPVKIGENQKVEFLLYKQGDTEPYLRLHLGIDVKE